MAQEELIKMSDLYHSDLLPFGRSKLTVLIKNGELEKIGKLPQDTDYIIAKNVGIGKKKARWVIPRKEIDAWRKRVENKKSI